MPFMVRAFGEMFDVNAEDDSQALEDSLNEAEDKGWKLVAVVPQNKQWPDSADVELMGQTTNMGSLFGPYFIFHD